MPYELDIPNLDDLVERYRAGEPAQDLALGTPVSGTTLLRRLRERGVQIRQGPTYRRPNTAESLAARALTRERTRGHESRHEVSFARWLTQRGVRFAAQKAIGPYNVDLALTEVPVAVEVSGGGGNAQREGGRRKRIEYILNQGWWVVEVKVLKTRTTKPSGQSNGRAHPLGPGSAEYVVALAEQLRWRPPARGQHRMVWADGQVYAAVSRQVD